MNIQLIYVSLDVNPFTNKPESLHSYGAFKKRLLHVLGITTIAMRITFSV
jgi:hypothetical protein